MKSIKLQKPYFILLKPANFQRFSRPEGILHNLCAIPDKRAQKTTFTRGQSQLLQAFVVRFYLAAFIWWWRCRLVGSRWEVFIFAFILSHPSSAAAPWLPGRAVRLVASGAVPVPSAWWQRQPARSGLEEVWLYKTSCICSCTNTTRTPPLNIPTHPGKHSEPFSNVCEYKSMSECEKQE